MEVSLNRYFIFDWFKRLKGDRIPVEDDYGSECLLISKINNTFAVVQEKIRNDRQLANRERANKVSISIGSVYFVHFDGRIGYEKGYRETRDKIVNRRPNRKSH